MKLFKIISALSFVGLLIYGAAGFKKFSSGQGIDEEKDKTLAAQVEVAE